MDHLKGFDEVLKYVNDLAGRIDVGSTILAAEGLYKRFEKCVEAIDRKDTLPGPRRATNSEAEEVRKDIVLTPELRSLLSRKWPT